MDFSLFLAKVMGLYFIIISLSVLINKNRMLSIVNDILQNPALQFIMGLNILIVGLLLIITHNIWIYSWELVITIVAWLIFIKGILNVAFPNVALAMTRPFVKSSTFPYLPVIINLTIGLFLCYYGFELAITL